MKRVKKLRFIRRYYGKVSNMQQQPDYQGLVYITIKENEQAKIMCRDCYNKYVSDICCNLGPHILLEEVYPYYETRQLHREKL